MFTSLCCECSSMCKENICLNKISFINKLSKRVNSIIDIILQDKIIDKDTIYINKKNVDFYLRKKNINEVKKFKKIIAYQTRKIDIYALKRFINIGINELIIIRCVNVDKNLEKFPDLIKGLKDNKLKKLIILTDTRIPGKIEEFCKKSLQLKLSFDLLYIYYPAMEILDIEDYERMVLFEYLQCYNIYNITKKYNDIIIKC